MCRHPVHLGNNSNEREKWRKRKKRKSRWLKKSNLWPLWWNWLIAFFTLSHCKPFVKDNIGIDAVFFFFLTLVSSTFDIKINWKFFLLFLSEVTTAVTQTFFFLKQLTNKQEKKREKRKTRHVHHRTDHWAARVWTKKQFNGFKSDWIWQGRKALGFANATSIKHFDY